MIREAFELKPLTVAAALGAVALVLITLAGRDSDTGDLGSSAVIGAFSGMFVQVGVRLLGVS
jgi:hypothetical protein